MVMSHNHKDYKGHKHYVCTTHESLKYSQSSNKRKSVIKIMSHSETTKNTLNSSN